MGAVGPEPGGGVEQSTDEAGEVASLDALPGAGPEADGKPLEGVRWGHLRLRKMPLAGTQGKA